MIITIKPCPFCGEPPKYEPSSDAEAQRIGAGGAAVICVNKACAAQPYVRDGELLCDDRGWQLYVAAAVKRWNRRSKRTRARRVFFAPRAAHPRGEPITKGTHENGIR